MAVKKQTVEMNDVFNQMMISAVRYALGRQTYIVSDTTSYIAQLAPNLNDQTVACMERDIRTAYSYGDENIDKPHWMRLLLVLQEELNKRNIKPW